TGGPSGFVEFAIITTNINMRLRSSLIYISTEFVGTKTVNEGGLVQPDKHDDFKLKPVDGDGLNQVRVESTNEGSLHPSEGEDADGTSRELLADAEELERARAVVSGREVKLKTEEYSDDYRGAMDVMVEIIIGVFKPWPTSDDKLVNAVTEGRHQELRSSGSFCESPKPNPTHVDAPVWEPLLNWFCFESNSSDDFPATTLDAEESDGWQQYQDKFVEMENHVDNVERLQARAEAARRPRDGNEEEKTRMQQEKHSVALPRAGDAQVSAPLSDALLHWQLIRLILITLKSGDAPVILEVLQLNLHI
ncbi:hypothetical protein THAOC_21004, partial [Thalassiosira oceanica]